MLPTEASDVGNITWTISSQDPPNSEGSFVKVPASQILRKRDPRIYNNEDRRASLGQLAITLASNDYNNTWSNKKLYEPGQVLEFSDVDNISELDIQSVPVEVEIIHNTNQLDLENLGLEEDDIISISRLADAKKGELETQLTQKKLELEIIKGNIVDNQKKINEADKAIAAVRLIVAANDPRLIRLVESRAVATASKDSLTDEYNAVVADIDNIYGQLLTISQLVR